MKIKKTVLGVVAGASILSISCDKVKNEAASSGDWNESNAFFNESTLPYYTADFDKIKDKDFKPALLEGMRRQMEAIDKIVANTEEPTFENTLEALERSSELLDRVSSVFGLLTGAHTNDELKAINSELAPKFAGHRDAIYLNDGLFQRIKKLHDNQASLNLNEEQNRLLNVYYENFEKSGANLSPEDKEKLKQLNQDIATLNNQFGDKLLAATKQGGVKFTKEELAGLSDDELNAIKQEDGSYVIALNNTTQQPDLDKLTNKETRKKLFDQAWVRAEKGDDNDTKASILSLVKKRAEKAKLMGFANYAEWSLQGSMAQNATNATKILKDLSPYAVGAAKEEAADIQALINKEADPFTLTAADWNYYAEKIREEKYALNQNELKPYFEMNSVLENGVFYMATQLYGLSFKERKDIPVWQEDVKVYEIFNEDGSQVGLFYTDYYQRDSKRGGAWMSNIVGQSKLLNRLPVIYNVGNFPKPAKGQPTLLSQDNVITMFHEFGHALHGFFANQTYPTLSGTSVSRDFVEFPSQFHEHFAFEPSVLKNYAKHYKTGEVIPDALVQKMKNAGTFNKGYSMTELLGASLLDMEWHTVSTDKNITDVLAFEKEALAKYGLDLPTVPPRYRSTYFSHIFGGGYAAGYYSYKWSEMLDFDAYDWLEQNGGMTRENGQIFRDKILSKGNSVPLDKLYKDFRGKNPTIDALLKYSGFTKK
ncbi:M3 family metallopeptidase [Myroides odoratimimus]|uniref:M3 family metallopeptidase n=1 Tax=Myroides TaxID=76831 RepID=UPI00057F2B06|nr:MULTISPECIES: M3 family metallopeptidase [Myroides]AJA69486.1 Zn-dependent oligopeptidase [Myroides sp. A21]MCA4793010.1 M3 family metallopeptidase [Myroides odoratimimus]MCA4807986.1 M3 family metallopeptidase [Myroides odoratimimus]MCA4820271.1 M3 family metallopeptidase [Myroides odoratimimus]MCO7724044.1 M3 family metallopeptidase [Myroides odoratimimus]